MKTSKTYHTFLLGVLAILLVGLSSNPHKGIWIDEFLGFTLAGYDSTAEAWNHLRESIHSINHGQTGVYMMLDFWLLKLFGASPFWLRFPSLLSAVFLLFCSVYLFHVWQLPRRWRVWGCLALFTQSWLMDFVSEARPYMPLAATAVGTLAYYETPLRERARLAIRLLGWTSVVCGAFLHPYFAIYWFVICFFAGIQQLSEGQEQLTVRRVFIHCNLPLCLVGMVVYFGIGWATWMPHRQLQSFDPYQWVGSKRALSNEFWGAHLGFLWRFKGPFLLMAVGSLGLGRWISSFQKARQELIWPVLLICLALMISAFLSYQSYRAHYWILQRQWIASVALVTLGGTWFAHRFSKTLNHPLRMLWFAILFGVVGWNTVQTLRTRFAAFGVPTSSPSLEAGAELRPPLSSDAWVALANANCAKGGAVWPVFRYFYGIEK